VTNLTHSFFYNMCQCILIDCFNTVTLASSYSALPDDGDHTETYWSCFSINFNTPFKAVLCSWSGQPARPQTQHDYHHDTKVKTEDATAVIELLMTGRKKPETCWAVNKRQDNKLENCCFWLLVIYLNFISEIISDGYDYTPAAYITTHCMIWS
jgi:hypothetical protein